MSQKMDNKQQALIWYFVLLTIVSVLLVTVWPNIFDTHNIINRQAEGYISYEGSIGPAVWGKNIFLTVVISWLYLIGYKMIDKVFK